MKRVAIFNFHPAFVPPRSGGELRAWNLAAQLSESFDVRMVNPTFGEAARESVQHTPHCTELRLPKTRAYNKWHHFFDRVAHFRECSALVATLACRGHREYVEAAREAAAGARIVMLSSPFMWPAIPRPKAGQLLVYDAYNVEARLAREALGGGAWGWWGARRIRRIERDLCRRADLILACSREDAEELATLHGVEDCRIAVVPNGVETQRVRPARPEERHAARAALDLADGARAFLFLGSYHPPNIEALDFLLGTLAPAVPGAEFLVAGKVCEAAPKSGVPGNVRLLGVVDDPTKDALLAACDGAVNPMFSGSGTNLKMLEFLAAGLPIVTTPTGARGLALDADRHALLADRESFAPAVQRLAEDDALRASLANAGRAHAVEHFDWAAIGAKTRELLEHKTTQRFLMLNDYPVTPVMSGGQCRLDAVARHVARHAGPVTIVTLCKHARGRHVWHGGGLEELNVPRSRLHNALDKVLAQWMGVAADDVSALLFWRTTPAFKRVVVRERGQARALLLDHIYMANAARVLRGGVPVVYESHNVETILKRALFGAVRGGGFLVRATERAERWALRTAAFTSCVSEEDARAFREKLGADGTRLLLAANGVDCAERPHTAPQLRPQLRAAIGMGSEPTLLFIGSGHPPNRDGVEFLIRNVAPLNPGCTFVVAGSVCGWFHGRRVPANVVMLGEVSMPVKEFLLQCADVALNTVFAGSGSSLKVPEYLSAGLPVISSEVGARGFAGNGAREVLVVPREKIAGAIAEYAADASWRREAAAAARTLAEERFDWSVTLKPLGERLSAMPE
ncbi:MAG: hypothetical protein PWP23_2078 [Candidatus Sumerlaeota bacterium]|nr:hypothetical protein [Candidatus Sumerlaeota bacterium]